MIMTLKIATVQELSPLPGLSHLILTATTGGGWGDHLHSTGELKSPVQGSQLKTNWSSHPGLRHHRPQP